MFTTLLLQVCGEKLQSWLSRRRRQFTLVEESDADPLAVLPERLRGIAGSLEAVSRQVEPDFLQLGKELQEVYSDASVLAQRTMDAVQLIGGEGGAGVLKKIDRIIHRAFADLESDLAQVGDDLVRLVDGVRLMGELNDQCPVIEKMALTLRVVGLNIGVESARALDAREMFSQVAVEVQVLSETITKIADNIRNGSLDAQRHQQMAHQGISGGLKHLTTVATDAEQTVKEAAGKIEGLVMRSLTAMDQASAHSREISGQVGRIVVGIQFHDNMNQRIDHINEALKDAAEVYRRAVSDSTSQEEPGAHWGRVHAIVDIQIAQLKQMITEVNEVYTRNLRAFDSIINRVGNLAQSLSLFDIGGASDRTSESRPARQTPEPLENSATGDAFAGNEDSLSNLKAALERFRDLLERSGRLHERIRETFGRATTAVENLGGYAAKVRRTNFEIHLIALNVIVKSAHMGDKGRAMEVLAQAVKGLSDQSNIFVAAVNSLLEKIVATVHIQRNPGELSGSILTGSSDAAMADGIARITDAYEKLNTDSIDIRERAGALTEATARTRGRLDFMTGLLERLTQCLGELEEIGALLYSRAGRAGADSGAEAARLAARYTMDRERIIHEERMGPNMGGAGALIPLFALKEDILPVRENMDKDELGDNIELF